MSKAAIQTLDYALPVRPKTRWYLLRTVLGIALTIIAIGALCESIGLLVDASRAHTNRFTVDYCEQSLLVFVFGLVYASIAFALLRIWWTRDSSDLPKGKVS